MEDIENVKKENRRLLRRKIWIFATGAFFIIAAVSLGLRLYFMHIRSSNPLQGLPVPSYASSANIYTLWYFWAIPSLLVIIGFIFIIRNSQ
jgi:hypothetical protein